MLSKYYEQVAWEVNELRSQKQGKEVCPGQRLRSAQTLSFHCYEPLCDKRHSDDPDYRKWNSKETFLREQIAVSELCESFEIVRQKAATLTGKVVSHRPTTLRSLNDHWDFNSELEKAAMHALFDETAELLAMLHMEVCDRKKDGIDIDQVYGSKFLSSLENAMASLWRKELKTIGNDQVYSTVATDFRNLTEGLVKEGENMLQKDKSLSVKPLKNMPDRVLQITRLLDQLNLQPAPVASFPQKWPAFQEACLIVHDFASASGAHSDMRSYHFKLADNLGNNFIILCNATVQACALYDQFAVAWYNRFDGLKFQPLDSARLRDMEAEFPTYRQSLKTRIVERALLALALNIQPGSSLEQIIKNMTKAIARQRKHGQLAEYLRDWWTQKIGDEDQSVSWDTFFEKLIQWFENNNLVDQLHEYEEELKREGCSNALLAASRQIYPQEGGQALYLLSIIIAHFLDTNHDDVVDCTKLSGLQVTAEEFAGKIRAPTPAALNELLDVIWTGCDSKAILKKAARSAKNTHVDNLAQRMQVRPIIQSYNVSSLLESHVAGTRQWLFDRFNEWLKNATEAPGAADAIDKRMFLLLADPGMGKSVFSAVVEKRLVVHACMGPTVQVRHFFKVGEQRAQGKTMVLCLAQQLADQVARMAALLESVVKEHGNAAALSMKEAFIKYLLEPLEVLDKEQQGPRRLTVVVILDALDEASDGSAGFKPVAALIAREFIKLPRWVKLIVTGRPEAEEPFAAWKPEWIEPSHENNQEDMRKLLEALLQKGGFVEPAHIEEAIQVLQDKSQGQFIWAKYAFDELSIKDGLWTPEEMREALPNGLCNVYKHILTTLQVALEKERLELWRLLHEKLLPVLVAVKEPLTCAQLAAVTSASMDQVETLLRLLPNLFPTRSVGSSGPKRVLPYHLSVLDWLKDTTAGWRIDERTGHSIMATACLDSIHAAATVPAVDTLEKGGYVDRTKMTGSTEDSMTTYALRYGVTHLCTARLTECLEELVLDFTYFWPSAYAAGFGPDLLRDLIALGPISSSPAVKDVLRWLRMVSPTLTKYPKAALQLACDAPTKSIVSQHASKLPIKLLAKLLTKEENWSPLLSTLTGHTESVTGVAVAKSTVMSCSDDNTVRVWDLTTGECRSILKAHTDRVESVAISADGSTCVSGSRDKTVRVWDLATGGCRGILKGHTDDVKSVAISADGSTCVSGSRDKTVRTWDVASAAQLSCYGEDSLEGQHQMQLASKWSAHHTDTICPGHVQSFVGIGEDNVVIYWINGRETSEGGTRQPAAYLLPHLRPCLIGWHKLMFNCTSSTVSFFSSNGQFLRYLLVGH